MIALFVPRASSRTGSGVGGLGAGLGVLGSGPGLKSGLGLQINSDGVCIALEPEGILLGLESLYNEWVWEKTKAGFDSACF